MLIFCQPLLVSERFSLLCAIVPVIGDQCLMTMMKKLISTTILALTGLVCFAQPGQSVESIQSTARNFLMANDFNNATLVLNKGLEQYKDNLELQKDLMQAYFFSKDYDKAMDIVKKVVDRDDADVMTYQIAGNVYKALQEVKDCTKMYKKALKKYPKSGPLYSEYGELLFSNNDYSAIHLWEKGIEVDPSYSGNYYNAAMYYFYTKDKVWSLIYGEIFINMEHLGERGAAMKELLLKAYKEKLYADADMSKDQTDKSEFGKAVLATFGKEAGLASRGITTETLTMIRARFILDWYSTYAAKFPYRLFDYQQQLMREGMFEAYNQWLFGPVDNLSAYENWTKTHNEEYTSFNNFQSGRVFKMPPGQHYETDN